MGRFVADSREKTAVLVAGMHRSGTSALARALGLAGCNLPKTLMRQNDMEGRTKGYSESWVVTLLNLEILSAINHCGFEQAAVSFSATGAESLFRERALAALRDEFGDSRLFVLKDPQLCLLLRFWIDAVEAFGARPVVICPIRNPLEVARSQKSRSGTDRRSLNHLLLVWLRHVLDAEAASRDVPRAFTRYGDLLEDPSAVLTQAASALDVSWPAMSCPKTEEMLRALLSPVYRHHEFTHEDLRFDPRCTQSVRRTFEILNRWVDGRVCSADMVELDRTKAIVDEVTAALADAVIERETKLSELRSSLSWRVTAPLRAVRAFQRRIMT